MYRQENRAWSWFQSIRVQAADACIVEDVAERAAAIDANAEKLYRAAWATFCAGQQTPDALYDEWKQGYISTNFAQVHELERDVEAACTFVGDRWERNTILRRTVDNRLREIYNDQARSGSAVTPA